MKFNTFFVCAAVISLGACSKNEKAATLDNAASAQVALQAVQEKQSKAVEKGDPKFPLANYQILDDGKKLVFAYHAISPDPIDYEKLAAIISPDNYGREGDDFKRRDILNALKPQIDSAIQSAKGSKYYKTINDSYGVVGKYDFDSKTFEVDGVPGGSAYRYFGDDTRNYLYNFSNADKYKRLLVADEATARTIESLKKDYSSRLSVVVYFYANDVEIGKTVVKAEIMKVQLLNSKGAVLAEM